MEHSQPVIAVRDLQVGDMIDLRHDEVADPDRDNPLFMFENVCVDDIEHGVGEGQNDDLIAISAGSTTVAFPPDHEVIFISREVPQ